MLLLEAHDSLYSQRAHTLFNCTFECVWCFEKFLLKAISSAWRPPLSVHSQSAYFVRLYVWMCIMFWKKSSESHCFRLKPTTHCTFRERILCLIVCLNVCDVLKNFFWKPFLLLEDHHSVYIHRAHILFNCMFECVECFEKLLLRVIASASSPPLSVLSQSAFFGQSYVWMCIMFQKFLPKAIASAWSPPLSVNSKSAYFVQLYVWLCIMFQKTYSESHWFCLKPTLSG